MLLSARCSVALPAWLVGAALSQRVNGVSLHPTLCRSVRACLQLFTVSVDEAPVGSAVRCEGGHTYTCTHRLEGRQKKKIHSAARAIDKVAIATACPTSELNTYTV